MNGGGYKRLLFSSYGVGFEIFGTTPIASKLKLRDRGNSRNLVLKRAFKIGRYRQIELK